MYHAASVATVTSPTRIGVAALAGSPAGSINAVKEVKAANAAHPSAVPRLVPSAPATAPSPVQPNLPLGLLLTVNRPSANDAPASADYADMELALRAGNVASAQQAYVRLQSDLLLAHPTQTATGSAISPTNAGLNVVA